MTDRRPFRPGDRVRVVCIKEEPAPGLPQPGSLHVVRSINSNGWVFLNNVFHGMYPNELELALFDWESDLELE